MTYRRTSSRVKRASSRRGIFGAPRTRRSALRAQTPPTRSPRHGAPSPPPCTSRHGTRKRPRQTTRRLEWKPASLCPIGVDTPSAPEPSSRLIGSLLYDHPPKPPEECVDVKRAPLSQAGSTSVGRTSRRRWARRRSRITTRRSGSYAKSSICVYEGEPTPSRSSETTSVRKTPCGWVRLDGARTR